MAAKPSLVPTWHTAGSNSTTPDTGRRLNGWAVNSIPVSGEFNHEQNLIGQWLQYLSDGDFTGAATFASTVALNGALTANAAATFNALATFAASLTTTTLTASGLITANGGITLQASAGAHEFYHGEVIVPVGAPDGYSNTWGMSSDTIGARWTTASTAAGQVVDFPINLPLGSRLIDVGAYVTDTNASSKLEFKAFETDMGVTTFGAQVQLGATQVSAGTGDAILSITALNHTLVSGKAVRVFVRTQAATSVANHAIYGIFYKYDRPAP